VAELSEARPAPYAVVGALERHDHRVDEDYYSQAGDLYRLMSEGQRALLASNIAGALKSVPELIQRKQVEHFKKADPEYGERVVLELRRANAGDPNQVPVKT
jgi:catalase